ncbi:hypothetical protein [Evansella tamaricis]|uniref:Uncharacterized protein n=1 Tax=Evansella tamaricis TaxID=2069301 RepID=A0ABS6JJQ8_9BACI|nr:hypothetical protein [Evansella tamaricis]MBU9713878.1 hypothetical protein [Evansella tamaricis]
MSKTNYPGVTVIGGENIAALYGVNNGMIDWRGTGIQHFFYNNYELDLIHSATSFLRYGDGVVEIANRKVDGKSHPVHCSPIQCQVKGGFLYSTTFQSQHIDGISWTERIIASEKDCILVETIIKNDSHMHHEVEAGAYCILRNPGNSSVNVEGDSIIWEGEQNWLKVSCQHSQFNDIYIETPTGFVYRTLQQMNRFISGDGKSLKLNKMVGAVAGRKLSLSPGSEHVVTWCLSAGNEKSRSNETIDWNDTFEQAVTFWKEWLAKTKVEKLSIADQVKQIYYTNLVALKAAVLDGFVPADITGHYFSGGSPSYYARDAMMIARALILAGYKEESASILTYLEKRPVKKNGEFYQRYNAKGEPSEGANNDVFHQLDSQGYFIRNILSFERQFGEKVVSYDRVRQVSNVLKGSQHPIGLVGPEGGVNEGVFGPAYITSSNMFLYGGLQAAIELAKLNDDHDSMKEWTSLCEKIDEGIQKMWISEEERYGYGLVDYIPQEVVKKYDTPQYFGPLYGYPVTERMEKTNAFLLKHARFFGAGVGYTEQEYHHGPWLFNTGACAQYQAITGNWREYSLIVDWMVNHANEYGLMPEAIDGNDESICFINPLTWACAEFVSTIAICLSKDGLLSVQSDEKATLGGGGL